MRQVKNQNANPIRKIQGGKYNVKTHLRRLTKENLTMKTFFYTITFSEVSFLLGASCWFLLLGVSLSWAQFIVTNTSDSGAGSLRRAIDSANGGGEHDNL